MQLPDAYSQKLTLAQKSSIQFNKNTVKTRTESEEQSLLKSISQDNPHAFWQLWMLYQDYLYQRCQFWMEGNRIDAEEALSRARLKAWDKLPKNASKITNPKAWLTRMTHNLCVDIHRERKKGAKSTESIEIMAAKDDQTLTSNIDSPESVILRHELMMYIYSAIDNLPSKVREPFKLRYYQQKTCRNIAQHLGLSQDNVYKRTQQARRILRHQLKKYFSGVDNAFKKESEIDTAVKEVKVENLELSDISVAVVTKCPISYQVTATCLQTFSHAWYSFPSFQG